LVFLAALDPFFVINVTKNDYSSLYASYQKTPLSLGYDFYQSVLGPPFFIVGLAGSIAGIVNGFRRLDGRFIISVYSVLWLIVWLALARQTGIHHAIVGLPLMTIVGIFNIVSMVQRVKGRDLAVAFAWLIGVYAIANAVLTYGAHLATYRSVQARLPIFSKYAGPLRRDDFAEIHELVGELRNGPQPILVAASNGNMNFDVVAQAEKRFYPPSNRKLAVESNAQIDSRDPLPIEDLLRAGQIVVVTPFQYHIARDQQQVVESVADIVTQGVERNDFAKSNEKHLLQQRGVAIVYRRIKPTSLSDALDALSAMKSRVHATNVIFRDYWYSGDQSVPVGMAWNPDGSRNAYTAVTQKGVTLTLLRKTSSDVHWSALAKVGGQSCTSATISIGNEKVSLRAGPQQVSQHTRATPDALGVVSVHIESNDDHLCNVDLTQMVTATATTAK